MSELFKLNSPETTIDFIITWAEKLWIPILEILAGVIIGKMLKKIILKGVSKAPDPGLLTFMASASDIIVLAFFSIIAVESLGVKLTSIVTLVSALGLGISLALKENMSNVAGGMQILITKPFSIGDFISISEHKGTVSAIELMFTTLTTRHNKVVIVPYSLLVTDILINYSRMPDRKVTVQVPIAIPNDLSLILESSKKIIHEADLRLIDDPTVCYEEFVQGYAVLMVEGTVRPEDYEETKHQIATLIASKLNAFNPSTSPSKIEIVDEDDNQTSGSLKNQASD